MSTPLLCRPGESEPPLVLDERTWKNNSILNDEWEANVGLEMYPRKPEEGPLLLAREGIELEEWSPPKPWAIMKCRMKRGDVPPLPTLFALKPKVTMGWGAWVGAVVANEETKKMLADLGLIGAVRNNVHYNTNGRDVDGLLMLLSRWCTSTHTFVSSWGEFTPTLDDVSSLTYLPLMGDTDLMDSCLSLKAKEALAFLNESLSGTKGGKGHRGTHSGWVKFFTKEEGSKSKFHMAGFYAFFLDRYVFPGSPPDGMNARVFTLAAKMYTGLSVPLAPSFLATLYRRLDEAFEQGIRSKGRYQFSSYLDVHFLQMFMFEHFMGYALLTRKVFFRNFDDDHIYDELMFELC